MNPFEHLPPRLLTRRQMLRQMGTGLGLLGFAGVMSQAGLLVPTAHDDEQGGKRSRGGQDGT